MTAVGFRARVPGEAPRYTSAVRIGTSEAIVWDPSFLSGQALVKWKYALLDGARRKLPHSTSEYTAYERMAGELGLIHQLPTGGTGSLVAVDDITEVLPPRPLLPDELEPFAELLSLADVGRDVVSVFGSRAGNAWHADSDWDLLIHAEPAVVRRIRQIIAEALLDGRAETTRGSGTLNIFERVFPGGVARLLREQRYADTFTLAGNKISIAWTRPKDATFSTACTPAGFTELSAHVIDASLAPFRPALIPLQSDDGTPLTLVSYMRLASVLREGDAVHVAGWRVIDGHKMRLLQLNPERETLTVLA